MNSDKKNNSNIKYTIMEFFSLLRIHQGALSNGTTSRIRPMEYPVIKNNAFWTIRQDCVSSECMHCVYGNTHFSLKCSSKTDVHQHFQLGFYVASCGENR